MYHGHGDDLYSVSVESMQSRDATSTWLSKQSAFCRWMGMANRFAIDSMDPSRE